MNDPKIANGFGPISRHGFNKDKNATTPRHAPVEEGMLLRIKMYSTTDVDVMGSTSSYGCDGFYKMT